MTTTAGVEWDDNGVKLEAHQADENRVTPETRRLVYSRDNWRCRKCGEMETTRLTVHHVVFRSQGGGHSVDNLVTLCMNCHRLLHDKVIFIFRHNGDWHFRDLRHWRSRI